ncbi:hypothetical protein PoB_005268300 [Plakobranchus ocellatus]|uniref:Uncharacterized protein n=1 Tax=Plakobranchus ocellatus TaxID=259542 RepID=A0AAV4C443_9GAST|nr:hypothetical protein PoB_005268300 [Plakobranchus ocellatus]
MDVRVSLQLASGPSSHRHEQGRRPRSSGVGSTTATLTEMVQGGLTLSWPHPGKLRLCTRESPAICVAA